MENDKYFSIYAFTILAGLASVLTASMMAGFASMPSPMVFIEHLAMSLTVRAAYKSFGWNWGPWTFGIGARPVAETVSVPQTATPAADEKIAA